MPEHEIKTRVSVDGEQGYRQAIKSARDQLKLLEAQLKQATSAMGRNASE